MTQDSPDTTPGANHDSNSNSQQNSLSNVELIDVLKDADKLDIVIENDDENLLSIIEKYSQDCQDWEGEYTQKRPDLEQCTQKLYHLIDEILQKNKIEVDQIEYRTKTIESFLEKIKREGKSYSNPLEEITDLVGIRIIAYYQEDIDKICKLLSQEFDIDKNKSIDKSQTLEIDRFGYLSVHYIVSLSNSRKGLTEWSTFAKYQAEIQVRTVLQHAWATISHKLEYKSRELPKQLKRNLSRLSALLEVADKEFSGLREQTKDIKKYYKKQVKEKKWEDIDINIYSLEAYLDSNKKNFPWIKIAKEIGFVSVNPKKNSLTEVNYSAIKKQEFSKLYRYCWNLFQTNNPEIMPKITMRNGEVIMRAKIDIAPINQSRIDSLSKVLNLIEIKTIKEVNTILENANKWGRKALESFYNIYKSTYTSHDTRPNLEPNIRFYIQATPYTIIFLFALYYKKDDLNKKNQLQPDFLPIEAKRVLEFFNAEEVNEEILEK